MGDTVNTAGLPKTLAPEAPVVMNDLRPAFGALNFQIRRLGLNLQAAVDEETGVVTSVNLVSKDGAWWVDCETPGCGTRYDPARAAVPTCPNCGAAEPRR